MVRMGKWEVEEDKLGGACWSEEVRCTVILYVYPTHEQSGKKTETMTHNLTLAVLFGV